jgi:hypothetical protein
MNFAADVIQLASWSSVELTHGMSSPYARNALPATRSARATLRSSRRSVASAGVASKATPERKAPGMPMKYLAPTTSPVKESCAPSASAPVAANAAAWTASAGQRPRRSTEHTQRRPNSSSAT